MKSKEEWKVYGNVFSEFSLQTLFKMSGQGYFDDLKTPLAIGKEANVFTAITKEKKIIVAKIYRLENCNFNKMYNYISADMRYSNIKRSKREIVFAWTQREYRNLMKAREVIKVPTPIAVRNNILLMEFIGKHDPAPMLKSQLPKNPKKFFAKTIQNIKKLYKAGLIHGDLSEYNILNYEEEPIFIDFSQCTTTESGNAKELLDRDINNVCNFFKKYFDIDEKKIKETLQKNQK
ncbi:MAG: serine protein kinase RIO [Candidatus Woesearchaeota archaeon]